MGKKAKSTKSVPHKGQRRVESAGQKVSMKAARILYFDLFSHASRAKKTDNAKNSHNSKENLSTSSVSKISRICEHLVEIVQ
jgi:hypothetical protein